MARSRRLIDLDGRFKELRNLLLPRNFSPTGNYDGATIIKATSFRVLFCSEIESFFEETAQEIVSFAIQNVNLGIWCVASSSAISMYRGDSHGAMPAQLSEIEGVQFIKRIKLAALHDIRRKIDSNNGIKPYNILSMFIPLGVDETNLDPHLFFDLSTLSARRGEVAHRRLSAVMNIPDPREEWLLANRIMNHLKIFELSVQPCLRALS